MSSFIRTALAAALLLPRIAPAAEVIYQFSGVTSSNMTVNNGTSAGTVPAGTPYTGTATLDNAQAAVPSAAYGGTHTVYQFTQMTTTMGGATATWGPGKIDVYDNLTTNTSYPAGDSVYIGLNGPQPNGLLFGAQFNWIFVALLDKTGAAVTNGALPPVLDSANFSTKFIEFNYGTLGTPWGAGNTSTIQPMAAFARNGATTPPSLLTTSLPNAVVNQPYSAAIQYSTPDNHPATLSVTGLPPGLGYASGAITGIPQAAGTSSVSITVTDTTTTLSTSATLPLTVSNPAIQFAPALANGVINAPYSSTFPAATGGTGVFTYSASGLPPGLTLSGTTVSGTPSVAGTFAVTLTAADSAGTAVPVTTNLLITDPVPVPCSGANGVITAYVARTPGYIVVNGGLNLLDHLWTTNLGPSTVTFLGGLTNWYQTGLIADWTGTTDPLGCILTKLTVRPRVTIDTAYLPGATAGLAYSAPVSVSWGVTPYRVTVAGLPSGLSFDGSNIAGKPMSTGTFDAAVTAVDSAGAIASKTLSLTVADQPVVFTPSLPSGHVGASYSAVLSATGFGPFTYGAAGLPAGLSLSGNTISGTPSAAGTFTVTLTAASAGGTTVTATAALLIEPASYSIKDEGQSSITAIGAGYLMAGTKKLIWDSQTVIKVNTPDGPRRTIDGFVKAGMKVQWKGMRDPASNTVLTQKLEVN